MHAVDVLDAHAPLGTNAVAGSSNFTSVGFGEAQEGFAGCQRSWYLWPGTIFVSFCGFLPSRVTLAVEGSKVSSEPGCGPAATTTCGVIISLILRMSSRSSR